jgi:hypothetical protein
VTGSELTTDSISQCNGGAESVVVEFEPGEVLFGFVELPPFSDDDVQLFYLPDYLMG